MFRRSCNITIIGRRFHDWYNVVSQKSVANQLGYHFVCLHLHLLYRKRRGVPCMTRVLITAVSALTAYNTTCVEGKASKSLQRACHRTVRGSNKCPRYARDQEN